MASYKQLIERYEDRCGMLQTVFVISDNYNELRDLSSARQVECFKISSVKHDIEDEYGRSVDDDLQFSFDYAAAQEIDSADKDAMDLVLSAQDGERVYVAIYINPNSLTPPDADQDFLGVVRSNMGGTDEGWQGQEYDSDIKPPRDWKASARSIDWGVILSTPHQTCLDELIADDWADDNVADRESYFKYVDPESHEVLLEARMARLFLVADYLDALIEKAISLSDLAGTSYAMSFDSAFSTTDLSVYPARFCPDVSAVSVGYQRFCHTGDAYSSNRTYKVIDSDAWKLRFKLGPTPESDETELYANWRLLQPRKGEEELSWIKRYETIGALIAGIAKTLGCKMVIMRRKYWWGLSTPKIGIYPIGAFADNGTEILVRDATRAELTIDPLTDVVKEGQSYRAQVWQLNGEGRTYYYLDALDVDMGNFATAVAEYQTSGTENQVVALDEYAPIINDAENEKLLAFALGCPTQIIRSEHHSFEQDDGGARDFTNDSAGVRLLPINTVFYSYGERETRSGYRPPRNDSDPVGDKRFNTEALDLQMYVKVRTIIDDGSVGSLDRDVWLPVVHVEAIIDGVQKGFDSMAEYVNTHNNVSLTYRKTEYTITVPYISAFRLAASPTGPDSWKNAALGNLLTLDSRQYRIVSVDRNYDSVETTLRIQYKQRFDTITISPVSPGNSGGSVTDPAGRGKCCCLPFMTVRYEGSVETPPPTMNDFIPAPGVLTCTKIVEDSGGRIVFNEITGEYSVTESMALEAALNLFFSDPVTQSDPGQAAAVIIELQIDRGAGYMCEHILMWDYCAVCGLHRSKESQADPILRIGDTMKIASVNYLNGQGGGSCGSLTTGGRGWIGLYAEFSLHGKGCVPDGWEPPENPPNIRNAE